MSLAMLQEQLIPTIEINLQTVLNSHDFGQSQPLKQMIAYHMGWQAQDGNKGTRGKRIRPMLTLLCAGAFNADIKSAIPAAVAIELLHNFTLIHDDIQDNSPLRHGCPTLWKLWGIPQAINAGDALFSIAQWALLGLAETCNVSTAVEAARQLNQVCLHLTRGQYLDIAFETEDEIELDSYLDMIEGKTAALIAFSTAVSGLVANQHQTVVESLSDFGKNLGLAFQTHDDYLGIWGDPQVTGKSTASDLLTQKKTLPVLFGLVKCPEFQALWNHPEISPEQIKYMSELLVLCGAQDFVRNKTKKYTQRSFETLRAIFPEKNSHARALSELCQILLDRKS
jgi:geranylgeranyl diphosphate synthase, type I